MRFLYIILTLLIFNCDEDNPVAVIPDPIYGCTDLEACNYDSEATEHNGTCGYQSFSCYSLDCASDLTIANTNILKGGTLKNMISAKRYILSEGEWHDSDLELNSTTLFAPFADIELAEICANEVVDDPSVAFPWSSGFAYNNCIVSVFINPLQTFIIDYYYWYVENNIFISLNSELIPEGIYQIETKSNQVTLHRDISSAEYNEIIFSISE